MRNSWPCGSEQFVGNGHWRCRKKRKSISNVWLRVVRQERIRTHFAFSDIGRASALISLPLKYMHTTVEMVDYDDIEGCIKLMYEFLIQLKAGHDFRYFT